MGSTTVSTVLPMTSDKKWALHNSRTDIEENVDKCCLYRLTSSFVSSDVPMLEA